MRSDVGRHNRRIGGELTAPCLPMCKVGPIGAARVVGNAVLDEGGDPVGELVGATACTRLTSGEAVLDEGGNAVGDLKFETGFTLPTREAGPARATACTRLVAWRAELTVAR